MKIYKKKILNILQKLKKNCDTYHNGNNIMKKISMFKELAAINNRGNNAKTLSIT